MFIRTQNIQSLNNPVHLAILVILVQTINKNFTHPFPSVNPPTYCISFNLVIDRFLFSILVEFCQWCVKFLSHLFTGPKKTSLFLYCRAGSKQRARLARCGVSVSWQASCLNQDFQDFGFSGLGFSHLYVFSEDREQCLSAPKHSEPKQSYKSGNPGSDN